MATIPSQSSHHCVDEIVGVVSEVPTKMLLELKHPNSLAAIKVDGSMSIALLSTVIVPAQIHACKGLPVNLQRSVDKTSLAPLSA